MWLESKKQIEEENRKNDERYYDYLMNERPYEIQEAQQRQEQQQQYNYDGYLQTIEHYKYLMDEDRQLGIE